MEVKIFEQDGERWTRFKVLVSQYCGFKEVLDSIGLKKPVKKSSRYLYFEVKGDVLNNKEART